MGFDVRQIRESDIEGFHAALSSVVSEKIYLATSTPPSLEDSARFVRTNIENDHAQYIAEIQGKLVGWADVIPGQKETHRHLGLLGIGVIAEHRGKGIGRQLLNAVMEHSWKKGLKRIELEVFANNLGAVALYENLGFEHEGTKRKGRLVNGQYEDAHIMAILRL